MGWLDRERSGQLGQQISAEIQKQQEEQIRQSAQLALRQSVFPSLAHEFQDAFAATYHPTVLSFQSLEGSIGGENSFLRGIEGTYALRATNLPLIPDTQNAAFIEIHWKDESRPVTIGGGYIGGFGNRVGQSRFTPLNVVLLVAKPNGDLFVVNKGKYPWSKPEMNQLQNPKDREGAERMLQNAVNRPIKTHIAIPIQGLY